ncbi:hypothetical protein SD78_2827 [Bacillus badius]|nr:hypothetical protein SD78_2827 [Bacillus badius]
MEREQNKKKKSLPSFPWTYHSYTCRLGSSKNRRLKAQKSLFLFLKKRRC